MPINLSKLFSFTNWATSHPTSPLPGDKVDDEFADVRSSLGQLDAKIGDVRRSDGALKNGLVTQDSLASGLVDALSASFKAALQSDATAASSAKTQAQQAAASAQQSATQAQQSATTAQAAAELLNANTNATLASINAAQAQATTKYNQAAALSDNLLNSANDAAADAATAEGWADVSIAWAEYLPGKIPPNILAIAGVTGDHWSSRWWANDASQKVQSFTNVWTVASASLHDFNKRYLGPSTAVPNVDANGETLAEGALYWNATSKKFFVWTGASWQEVLTNGAGMIVNNENLGTGAKTYKQIINGIAQFRSIKPDNANFSTTETATEIQIGLTAVEWTKLSGVPTTIASFGITDAYTKTQIDTAQSAQDTAIAARATTAYVDAQNNAQNTTIGQKADKTYVDTQDTALSTAIGLKADTTTVNSQIALTVPRTGSTGAAVIPTGSVAQRPASPTLGYLRYNSDTSSFEGWNGSVWGAVGGGATGGSTDTVFHLNDLAVTTSYTIPTGKNAGTFGPISINSGVTVTVPSGSVWTIV